MNFVPYHDNLLIQRNKTEEKTTPGGVVLPAKSQEAPVTAVVIAVGPEVELVTNPEKGTLLKEGDTVVLSQFAGTDIKLSDEDKDAKTVVRAVDILGFVE